MNKSIAKIWIVARNTLGILILLVLLLAVVATLYFRSERGEKYLRQQVVKVLERELDTKIEIGKITYHFPYTLELHQGVIYDHKDNPLVVFNKLHASLQHYSRSNNELSIRTAILNDFMVYGRQYSEDSLYNFTMQFNKLAAPGSGGGGLNLYIKRVQLNNGTFQVWSDPLEKIPEGVDFDHVYLSNLQGNVTDLAVAGEEVSLTVNSMSFSDTSGFVLDDLRTEFSYSREALVFDNTHIRTPHSELNADISFTYSEPADLQNFITNVRMEADLRESYAVFYDIAFFAPELPRNTHPITISGQARGPIANLSLRELDISFGDNSVARGRIDMRGLPDIEQTFFEVKLDEARTSYEQLKKVLPFTTYPPEIAKFGLISTNGNFTGFLQDFVAHAHFNTALGRAESDINLKVGSGNEAATYSGNIKLRDFHLGKLIDQEQYLGRVTLDTEIEGKSLQLEKMVARLNSDIKTIKANGYTYSNIKIEGDIEKELFEGVLIIDDPNIDLDFAGTIDFTGQKPRFDFVADVADANLHKLNLTRDTMVLTSSLTFNFVGTDLDSFEGDIIARNTNLVTASQTYKLDSLSVSSRFRNNFKQLEVKSDLADIYMEGDFLLRQLPTFLQTVAANYTDTSFFDLEMIPLRNEYINFSVNLKNPAGLLKLVDEKLHLNDTALVEGRIEGATGKVTIDAFISSITYDSYTFNRVKIKGRTVKDTLSFTGNVAEVLQQDSLFLTDLNLDIASSTDSLEFHFYVAGTDKSRNLTLNGLAFFEDKTAFIRLENSRLVVLDSIWKISSGTMTLTADSVLQVPHLELSNNYQRLVIDGRVNRDLSYPVNVRLDSLDISLFNDIVPSQVAEISGKATGNITYWQENRQPVFEADLTIESFALGEDTLGRFSLVSSYQNQTKNIKINGRIISQFREQLFDLSGDINFHTEQNYNLALKLSETDIGLLEEFTEGVVSNLQGALSANVKIGGSFDKPDLSGNIDIKNGAATVDYLGTRYQKINHTFTFDNEKLVLNNLRIADSDGNIARVDKGRIIFNKLNDILLDIDVILDEPFKVLNTTVNDNDLYYGTGYATGTASFFGPLDLVTLNLNLRTERGTDFNLPVSEDDDYSGPYYIRFIDAERYLQEEYDVNITGIIMNFRLEVTEDALMKIIIDPQVGDIIQGRGTGNLRMEITSLGDFNIFGDYYINQGQYLFTAWDVINKQFRIEPGSSLRWSGDPYGAQVDLTAIYELNAVPADLLPEGVGVDDPGLNQSIPVQVVLDLDGELFAPEIGLDVRVPYTQYTGSFALLDRYLQNIKNDEQELSKQVVSLMVIGRFARVNTGIATTDNLLASTGKQVFGEFITNQINYWLSQVTDNFQVQFDHRARTAYNEEEVKVALTASLFNDRVKVNTAANTGRNNIENVEITGLLDRPGNIRLKVFRRSDDNPLLQRTRESTSYGLGFFYRKTFNSFKNLFGIRDRE